MTTKVLFRSRGDLEIGRDAISPSAATAAALPAAAATAKGKTEAAAGVTHVDNSPPPAPPYPQHPPPPHPSQNRLASDSRGLAARRTSEATSTATTTPVTAVTTAAETSASLEASPAAAAAAESAAEAEVVNMSHCGDGSGSGSIPPPPVSEFDFSDLPVSLLGQHLSRMDACMNANGEEFVGGKDGERIQNCQNEEQGLDVTYTIAKLEEKLSVIWELKPIEPPRHRYGVTSAYHSQAAALSPMRATMRLVCVVDVSHSMADKYGPEEADISKLDKVKMFARLVVKTLSQEDYFGLVTFGTTAQVLLPLNKMTEQGKTEALRLIDGVKVNGVTNLSSGLFSAVELFRKDSIKSRFFDDNILLFTDGMANEGITESSELVPDLRRRMKLVQSECHFENDYRIKLCTMGTFGFLAELIFEVGQAFSSDAFYLLDDASSLELNLIRPVILRQTCMVSNIGIIFTGLNGVTFDKDKMKMNLEFENKHDVIDAVAADDPASVQYWIHDMAADIQRHLVCVLKLPNKHKKLLKGKDVLRIDIHYRDTKLACHMYEKTIAYAELPTGKKDVNPEPNIVIFAKEELRATVKDTLDKAAVRMLKLDRAGAKQVVQEGVEAIRGYCEHIATMVGEEFQECLVQYTEPILSNLDYCDKLLGDFTVRWDDGWGRVKGISSSIAREVPTTTGLYMDGAELFNTPKMQERLDEMCAKLKDLYICNGYSTDFLDHYHDVIKELKIKHKDDDDMVYTDF